MNIAILCATGAVTAAATAGTPGGTGENYCHLTWDKQCCPVPGCDVSIAPGILTICNEKPNSDPNDVYIWELIDTSGMGLQFMPQSGEARPGGNAAGIGGDGPCIDVPFTVICPPQFPTGSVADYQAIVTKASTGEQFTCFGNVVNHSDWKLDTTGDPVIDVPVITDATAEPIPARAHLVVSNIGSSGKDGVSIDLQPMGPFQVNPPRLQIPPIPPGSSWAVDSFFDIAYDLGRRGLNEDNMGDILFLIDTDGDNVGDTVIGSLTVRGVPAPCPTDINGDGVVDTADLGLLIGAFGMMCP